MAIHGFLFLFISITEKIRLTGDNGQRGRLEVYFDGEWGSVCNDNFGEREGKVVCNQLGFRNADVDIEYKLPNPAPEINRVCVVFTGLLQCITGDF